MSSAPKPALTRLKREYLKIAKEPPPYVAAAVPKPSNILEWHYVVRGPESTPYESGYYHGKLIFPPSFPFKPPQIHMITPSGRFRCNTRLCLSISDYHPDTWNPSWSVSSILIGLLSFMVETTPTHGSIETTLEQKRTFAKDSGKTNLSNKQFCILFPELVEEINAKIASENAKPDVNTIVESSSNQEGDTDGSEGGCGVIANVILIVVTVLFYFVVKAVIESV